MNNLTKVKQNLPNIIEDLAKFVLVGREKLTAVRANIRAINKLQLAEEVREQKREEQTAIQKNVHNAIYKILCIDISKEDLNIWYDGLDKGYLETLEDDMDRAIKQYESIKEFIKEKRKIRRIK